MRFTKENVQLFSLTQSPLSHSLPFELQRLGEVRLHQLPQHAAVGRRRARHRRPTSPLHRQVQDVSSQRPDLCPRRPLPYQEDL